MPDAIERAKQGSEHQPRAPCLDRRKAHRFGIEAVELIARMRVREPHPMEKLGAVPIIPQEVQRRAVREMRDVGNHVAVRHKDAVVALGGQAIKGGARLAVGGLELSAPTRRAPTGSSGAGLESSGAIDGFGDLHETIGSRRRRRRLHSQIGKPGATRAQRQGQALELRAMRQSPIAPSRIGNRDGA